MKFIIIDEGDKAINLSQIVTLWAEYSTDGSNKLNSSQRAQAKANRSSSNVEYRIHIIGEDVNKEKHELLVSENSYRIEEALQITRNYFCNLQHINNFGNFEDIPLE